jgi:hypothetical protein
MNLNLYCLNTGNSMMLRRHGSIHLCFTIGITELVLVDDQLTSVMPAWEGN